MPQPGDGREWTEHWRGQRARSPSTPVAYFMCSPQESRASHQNWSRYGDRSFCCPPWPGNICTREKQSPESLVSKLNKETISDLKQGKFPCCCCPNDCSTPTASTCIELHHLNMKHSKWLLNRGTTVPIKRATFAQHSLQQILLMVTNIPMSCWRLPGSEYYISTRHLTLVQGTRVSPFRWALLKISCGKFAWAFWCLGRALITNCLQGKKYRESWHSCTGITPPCTLSHPPAISLADFNDNNCHAHVWTVTPITQQLIPELRRVAHSDSHRKNFLWELQISLHRYFKKVLSKFFFMRMQRPCSAQANIASWVLTSRQNARDQALLNAQCNTYKTSVAEQGSKMVCAITK